MFYLLNPISNDVVAIESKSDAQTYIEIKDSMFRRLPTGLRPRMRFTSESDKAVFIPSWKFGWAKAQLGQRDLNEIWRKLNGFDPIN